MVPPRGARIKDEDNSEGGKVFRNRIHILYLRNVFLTFHFSAVRGFSFCILMFILLRIIPFLLFAKYPTEQHCVFTAPRTTNDNVSPIRNSEIVLFIALFVVTFCNATIVNVHTMFNFNRITIDIDAPNR